MFTAASLYWMLWVLKISYSNRCICFDFHIFCHSGKWWTKTKDWRKLTVMCLLSCDV